MITPNSGKLQHHLGLLGNDKDRTNEELHSVDYLVNAKILPLPKPSPLPRVEGLSKGTAKGVIS